MIGLNHPTGLVKTNAKQILYFITILLSFGLLTMDLNFLSVHYPYNFLQNYTHVIIFMIIIQPIYKLLPFKRHKLMITFIIALSFAFSTEILQIFNSRDADPLDFLFNFCGITVAVLWIVLKNSSSEKIKRSIKIYIVALLSIIMSSFFYGFSSIIYTQYRYSEMLPLLADFENRWELERLVTRGTTQFELSTEHVGHGSFCLEVNFDLSRYSRVDVRAIPSNWSQYQTFCFDVFNPREEVIDLNVRFYDRHSLQFAKQCGTTVKLNPGDNNIRIPIATIKNSLPGFISKPGEVQKIVFYIFNPQKRYTLFFDYLRFE